MLPTNLLPSIIIPPILAYHGYHKGSLSSSGALAALAVGFFSITSSLRGGLIMLAFYYSSSKLTKLKHDVKMNLEEGYAIGGNRNAIQVFASSLLATVLSVVLYFIFRGEDSVILSSCINTTDLQKVVMHENNRLCSIGWSAVVSHYACANGDTWASEVGILSKSKPRLVTTLFLREVPKGTNGGISILGTLASTAGGCFIGVIFWIVPIITKLFQSLSINGNDIYRESPIILIGALSGFLGSLIDSLLGATLQATYYSTDKKRIVKKFPSSDKSVVCICGNDILSNEAVNFLSIAATMLLSIVMTPAVYNLFDRVFC
eukprot:gene10954-14709_t